MKNITSRLKDIENKVTKAHISGFDSILKIERWIFDIGSKDSITLQEWEEYKNHELAISKDQQKTYGELAELEDKIRKNEGFMELIFHDSDGRVLGHVY